MELKKTILCCAVGTALGVVGSSALAAQLAVQSWTLQDFDGDGLQSDFNFVDPPTGSSGNIFGTLGETGCGNTSNADGTTCDPIGFGSTTQQAVDAFTTGFNFGGGGDFQPQILDNYTGNPTGSMAATIETTDATGQALQFSALDFAGLYQGVNTFLLPPDHLANCTGEADGALGGTCGTTGVADTNPQLSNPLGYNVQIDGTVGGALDYGVVVDYAGTIAGSGTTFDGNEAHWRLEGVMTVVPVPAAVWLFGSGLLGLVGVARRRRAK